MIDPRTHPSLIPAGAQPIVSEQWPYNWCWRCDASLYPGRSKQCKGHEEPYDTEKRWFWVVRTPTWGYEEARTPMTEWAARFAFIEMKRKRASWSGHGVLVCNPTVKTVIETFGNGLVFNEDTGKWDRIA